jgi:Flp pilus assembly protein TadG
MRINRDNARRGAIAPLTAILLIPLLAMMAFSIDLGYITHTQNELQSAADAAALAGAGQLTSGFVQYYLPGQTATAKTTILSAAKANAISYAKKYAGYNGAGGVKSLTLLDSDIELGYTDTSGTYTALPTYTGYPNTVKVTLRRDSSANTPLNLFFGPVLGKPTASLTATAKAATYAATVNDLSVPALNTRILPMTYDINHWNNFLATGKSPDGTTSTASNGYPDLNIYPSIKFTGNFGELSLDQGNDGASTISGWINTGVTSNDLKQEYTAGLLPLSTHNPLAAPDYTTLAPDWKGNPGLKDSTIKTVGDNVGQLYLLPLFKPVNDGSTNSSNYQAGTGNGSNYYYTIVEFVGVSITSVDSTGSNKSINVQPSSLIVPNSLLTGAVIATAPTSTSPLSTIFSPPKLIQ